MATNTSPTKISRFVRTLRQIADSSGVVSPAEINKLARASQQDIEDFRAEWPRINRERQRAIVNAMNEAAELSVQSDFTDLFFTLLDDPDEFVRAGAVDGLWENELPKLARRLLRMLMEDQSSLVRAFAAEGLGHFLLRAEEGRLVNPTAAALTEALLTRFGDEREDLDVRRHALESIAFSSDSRVNAAIRRGYDEDEPIMRASAVFAMGRTNDMGWSEVVLRELPSRDAAMRYEAAYAAGELMLVDALPALFDVVSMDSDTEVRQSAIWALGQIGGNEARRVLEAILDGGDEALRTVAEDALSELDFGEGMTPFDLFEFDVEDASNGNGEYHDESDDEEEEE